VRGVSPERPEGASLWEYSVHGRFDAGSAASDWWRFPAESSRNRHPIEGKKVIKINNKDKE